MVIKKKKTVYPRHESRARVFTAVNYNILDLQWKYSNVSVILAIFQT